MMRGDARGASSVRLVQDFGIPDDAAGAEAMPPPPPAAQAQAAPATRGRGRPPGSRTRQAARQA